MAYVPPSKPLGEFTREEFSELVEEIKNRVSPEEYEALREATKTYAQIAKWWQDDEDTREEVEGFISGMQDGAASISDTAREIISAMQELLPTYTDSLTQELARVEPQSRELATLQDVRIPDDSVGPKDMVTRRFFSGELEPGTAWSVKSGSDKKPFAPQVTVSLLDLPPHVEMSQDPTQFDNAVFRAACSLYRNGTLQFTGGTIWKTMKGDPDAEPSPDTLAAIDESWTRLTSVAIEIDTQNVGDVYGFVRWVRNRRVIEGGSDTLMHGNQHGVNQVTVYTMTEEPTLLTYADQLGQIERYPLRVLNTPVNKTPEIIVLQQALLDHIEAIPNISNHIKYDTLFAGVTAKTPGALRKKKATLRKQVRKMLEYWASIGFIKSWSEEKKGNAIVAIVIQKGRRKELQEGQKKW